MLEISHVTKLFNPGTTDEDRTGWREFDDESGDFVTVIGSNGAGKSTLMNIISGVMKPDMGDVLINDRSIKTCLSISAAAGSAGCSRIRWQERPAYVH